MHWRPHMTKVGTTRAALILSALAALELLCRVGIINRVTMIPPSEMIVSLWSILRNGRYNADIFFTLYNVIAATFLAVIGGFLAGAALHALPRLRRPLVPLLSAYYAIPTFVFYPLLIVAFGVGRTALIVMGAMFGVVAMIVNTAMGLHRVPSAVLQTASVMRLGPLSRLVLVRLPAASPYLVTGVRLAVAYAVIGIVAGEFILATAG